MGVLVTVAVVTGLLPLVMILVASPAWACSCAGMSDAKYAEVADVVFTGRLVDRTHRPDGLAAPVSMLFAVDRVYKGDSGQLTRVWNTARRTNCALALEGRGLFLVFADHGRGGRLYSHLCSGTRELSSLRPAALGPGHPPASVEQRVPLKPAPPGAREPGSTEDNNDAVAPWLIGGVVGLTLLAGAGWLTHHLRRHKSTTYR